MKILKVETGKTRVLFILPPENAWDFRVDYGNRIMLSFACIDDKDAIELPDGKWSDPIKVAEVTEEVAMTIVKQSPALIESIMYDDYIEEQCAYVWAYDSFQSLLKANYIFLENPIGEEPQIEDYLSIYQYNYFKYEWDIHQEQTSKNWLMLIEKI